MESGFEFVWQKKPHWNLQYRCDNRRDFHQPLIYRNWYLNSVLSYISCLASRRDPMSLLTWRGSTSPDLHFLLTAEQPQTDCFMSPNIIPQQKNKATFRGKITRSGSYHWSPTHKKEIEHTNPLQCWQLHQLICIFHCILPAACHQKPNDTPHSSCGK